MSNELIRDTGRLIQVCKGSKGVIFVDSAILETHGKAVQKMLGFELIAVPTGEIHKTRKTKEMLEDELLKRKYGRDTLIVALGGGTITDLIGYLASTYMRGVRLILIPTTLLGVVDAAIGGKTAVNTPFGKNQIGTFYFPEAIFIHLDFLKTLPKKEWVNGLGEILKYGLIDHAPLWNLCKEHIFDWQKAPFLDSIIQMSIEIGLKITQKDPKEKGLRRILNFGHTVGHALELLSNFQMSHGEAVALGCMAESYLSHRMGYLSKEAFDEILSLFQKFHFSFPSFEGKALLDAMVLDKKTKNNIPRFVFIDKIGHSLFFDGEYCQSAPKDALDDMIHWMHGQKTSSRN